MPKRKARAAPALSRNKKIQLVSQISDPIIDDLRKYARFDLDLSTALDQIALEGLSGITFGRLVCILGAVCRFDGMNIQAQVYIWKVLITLLEKPEGAGIKAYSTPARSNQSQNSQSNDSTQKTVSDQVSSQDSKSSNQRLLIDKEIKLPKDTMMRISKQESSIFAIQDGFIMGSCQEYLTRTDVSYDLITMSKKIQDPLEAMYKVNEKYDSEQLKFVADQEVRRRSIMPDWSDPNVDIKPREYACLELIGRTRSLGIVFPNDKALGRYRILLASKGFISQYQPTCTSHIVHHLVRFSKCIQDKPPDGKIYKQETMTSVAENTDIADENDDDDGGEVLNAKSVCCLPRRLRIDNDMLRMVYNIIAHSRGRSPLDIRRKLRLPKFHVRNHLKNLANIELVGSHTRRIDDQNFRIYRARHRSLVYKKKLRERMGRLKSRKSDKCKFDEVDLKAKSILGHRRSQFTQAEDSLLILCRICCLLIEPTLTKKVSFCVNKRFIRNLLHDELCESHDKTADACLRRIKYLRNLPNNIMSINELTAELREDSDITKQISREKLLSEEKLNRLFLQTLKIVRNKLPQLLGIKSDASSNIRMSSYHDLHSKYELIDCRSTSNRYTPGATVLQFAHPIGQFKLDLSECNEMTSVALLSSMFASTFNIELNLKIPSIIVGLDQSQPPVGAELSNNIAGDSRKTLSVIRKFGNLADALIVQPCNVKFRSNEIIKFKNEESKTLSDVGESQTTTKLKTLIKAVLSWIIIMPGIDFANLTTRVKHLMNEIDLGELLRSMDRLELISEHRLEPPHQEQEGFFKIQPQEPLSTYEPKSNAYLKYCQLLKQCR